jgi:hypothetical protein
MRAHHFNPASALGGRLTRIGIARRRIKTSSISTHAEGGAMRTSLLSTLLAGCGLAVASAAEFKPPVRLKAGDVPVRVESPGYAAPC